MPTRLDTRGRGPRLPTLLRGARRVLLATLVGTALAYTGLAVAAGLLVGRVVANPAAADPATVLFFVLAVAGLGVARYLERVVAERLGQHYVRELRTGLVGHALAGVDAPSMGITVARTTNDLSSVRNWIAQGITPLIVAVPLVSGCLVALWLIDWRLAVAVALPLALLGAALLLLAGPAFSRARTLRRLRGRMAARISDTVQAAPGIAAAGGIERELRRIDKDGANVADAAVHRARTAGALRAVSMSAPLLATGTLAAAATLGAVDAAGLATALTLAGVLGAPMGELGRVVEYRQNYKAARRIIAPLLASGAAGGRREPTVGWPAGPAGFRVRWLVLDEKPVPALGAEPGDRILVESASGSRVHALFTALAAGRPEAAGCLVDGVPLGLAAPRTRRRLVGYAYSGGWLERGTLGRAVRYRVPSAAAEDVASVLDQVGLASRLEALEMGEGTRLLRGGQPLGRSDVARLQLARSLLGTPRLLLLEGIDGDLDTEGAERLRGVLDGYPGVVICASSDAERLGGSWRTWDLDAGPARGPEAALEAAGT